MNLTGEGLWLAVQSQALPQVAHGVAVSWPPVDLRRHFACGAAWRWHGAYLDIDSLHAVPIRICMRDAATWRSTLRAGGGDPARLRRLACVLWRECGPLAAGRSLFFGNQASPVARRARTSLRLLSGARDLREADMAVRKLVGLGPGLTPAGDDVLIGWLAGEALLPAEPERERRVLAVREAIRDCLPLTTDVSRAHLADALCSEFSQSLSLFANALAAADPSDQQLRSALRNLAAIGASSGLDAAAGLLTALSAAGDQAMQRVDASAVRLDPGEARIA